jgi:hypothetical protein
VPSIKYVLAAQQTNIVELIMLTTDAGASIMETLSHMPQVKSEIASTNSSQPKHLDWLDSRES